MPEEFGQRIVWYRNNNVPFAVCIVNYMGRRGIATPAKPILISGAGAACKMSNGDKTVYMFDDMTHSNEQGCTEPKKDMVDFLKDYFRGTDKVVDFFSEMSPNEEDMHECYLATTVSTFSECTYTIKRGIVDYCQHNVRVHYADVREPRDWDELARLDEYLDCVSTERKFTEWALEHYETNRLVVKELEKMDHSQDKLLRSVIHHKYVDMVGSTGPFAFLRDSGWRRDTVLFLIFIFWHDCLRLIPRYTNTIRAIPNM